MFSSRSFIVSCLTFRFLIHLGLFLCMVLESVLVSFFYKWLTSFPAPPFTHPHPWRKEALPGTSQVTWFPSVTCVWGECDAGGSAYSGVTTCWRIVVEPLFSDSWAVFWAVILAECRWLLGSDSSEGSQASGGLSPGDFPCPSQVSEPMTACLLSLQVFPLSSRQLRARLWPTGGHERRHLELLSEGGVV